MTPRRRVPAQRVRASVRLRLTHSQQRDGALTPPRLRQAAARSLDRAARRHVTEQHRPIPDTEPRREPPLYGKFNSKDPKTVWRGPKRTHSSKQREVMESRVSYQEPQQQQQKSLRITSHHWRSSRSSRRRSRLLLCGNSPTVRDKNPERRGRRGAADQLEERD